MISIDSDTNGFPIKASFTVILSGSTSGRIRKLAGFQKHHRVPDAHSDATRDFVRKAGAEDVKTLADGLYNDIREAFGYKRKEFEYHCEAGLAHIKTPDFDAEVRVDQCGGDPKNYLLTTELTALHNAEVAQNPALHACFNPHCEVLVVNSSKAMQIEDKIDAIEENEALADYLSYEPDGSSFELKLPELDLRITVDAWSMRFQLLTLRNLAKLLEHSQKAFDILTECGFDLRLSNQD